MLTPADPALRTDADHTADTASIPPTESELSKALLAPLVVSYYPDQGDICVVVGVYGGGRRYFFTFANPSGARPPTAGADSIFEIGSTTMAFTSCLLAEMAARHEVGMHDSIKKFLPHELRVPSLGGQDITLLDLANHSSGLPRIPDNFPETITDPRNPCANYTVDHLYAFLNDYHLPGPVGGRRQYSNLGVGLLGHVLALAATQDYATLVIERIARPLGLSDTTVTLSAEQQTRFVPGHSAAGEPVAAWDMPALLGAGGLRSTPRDLLRFLEAHLNSDEPLHNVLDSCTIPTPKTGRTRPWPLRYALALGFAGLGLLLQSLFGSGTTSGWVFLLHIVPAIGASLFGGFAPALLTVGLQLAGTLFLWPEQANWPLLAATSLVLAWVAAANHRHRARKEPLGWHIRAPSWFAATSYVLWHSGETGGYASFIGLEKKARTAIVVLANSSAPVAPLGLRILDLVNAMKKAR